MNSPPPDPRGVRISDADRERAVARLNEALTEGRITVPELEARLGAAYAAVYQADLRLPLAELPGDDVVDLPEGGGRSDSKPLVPRSPGRGRRTSSCSDARGWAR